jgi:hypothetical protein
VLSFGRFLRDCARRDADLFRIEISLCTKGDYAWSERGRKIVKLQWTVTLHQSIKFDIIFA